MLTQLDNVWIGVSVEDQQTADERIPLLLQTPAAVRFVSCEPLLGKIDLTSWLFPVMGGDSTLINIRRPRLDFVIVGGETGPGARPMMIDWTQDIVDQCKNAGVPVFVKQLGTWAAKFSRLKEPKGADPKEWPESMQIREFPAHNSV